MKRLLASVTLALSLAPAVAAAQDVYGVAAAPAPAYGYVGGHPNHPAFGGGYCYLEGAHSHPYAVDPNVAYLYRNYNGSYVFVGNVYEFGYARQAYPYYNHHPLAPEHGGTYCYIDGAHYHSFVPPALYGANYVTYNGYYYYNGAYLPTYYTWRGAYYRSYHTYRYLPTYRSYYTNYRTYVTTYSRPASVSYGRPGAPSVTVSRPGTSIYRAAAPAYRYNNGYRPATGGAYRPTTLAPTTYRPTTNTTTGVQSRPAARVWRR